MMHYFKFLIFGLFIFALVGCESQLYRGANNAIDQTQAQISDQLSQTNTPAPVVIKKGYYVDTHPISLQHPPAWLTRKITLQANQMPMQMLVDQILRNADNAIVTYGQKITLNRPVALHYQGTVKGALDAVADQTGYSYSLDGNHIAWSDLITKTFDISFMPGSATYMLGQKNGGNSGSSSNYSSSSNTQVSDILTQNSQYSSLQASNLSVWKDLEKTLDQLKSKDGQVIVSEATTTVTVHDHTQNVAAMARYIKSLNELLSREVLVRVTVLEVDLDKEFSAGINWNLVSKALQQRFIVGGSLATDAQVTGNASTTTSSLQGATLTIGENTQTIINALGQQGKVRVVTQPQVVTMNDQVAEIRITKNTGYLQSVSTTVFDNNATSSLTPGSITDGFILYVLPKIQNNRVYMQISSSLSTLTSISTQTNQPTGSTSSSTYQTIQTPTISDKQFNQRSVVDSGSTLVIAGYKKLKDETKQSSFFGVDQLGGKGSNSENVQTLVLIAPTILQRAH